LTACLQSRAAAVSELTGETTADCEVAYDTALYMLFAILDESLADGEPIKEDDKATVNKCERYCFALQASTDP
jgi:serine/threonine-protein kinase ULK/ATG1